MDDALLLVVSVLLVSVILYVVMNTIGSSKRAERQKLLSDLRPRTLERGEQIMWEVLAKDLYAAFTDRRVMAYTPGSTVNETGTPLQDCSLVATDVHRRSSGAGDRIYGYGYSVGS